MVDIHDYDIQLIEDEILMKYNDSRYDYEDFACPLEMCKYLIDKVITKNSTSNHQNCYEKRKIRLVHHVDVIQPFYIGNFLHKRSSICQDLLPEASELLKTLGWNGSFVLYRDPNDTAAIRLYFKISYVGACFVEGTWPEIKEQLADLIPMIQTVRELRKQPRFGMLWTERNLKEMDWSEIDNL